MSARRPMLSAHRPMSRAHGAVAAAVCLGCLAVVGCLLPPAVQAQADPKSESSDGLVAKQRQVEQLDREKQQIKRQLNLFEADESELRIEVETLAEEIRRSRARRSGIATRIREHTALKNAQEAELNRIARAISSGRHRLTLRLRRMYRLSKTDDQATLFQLARHRTLSRDRELLSRLQGADRAALQRFQTLSEEAQERRKEVAASLAHLALLDKELRQESEQLAQREAYLRESLRDLGKNRNLYSSYLVDLERMMDAMAEAVLALERQMLSKPTPQPVAPGGALQATSPEMLRGHLPAPVAGQVIAAFGESDPRYDLKKFQRGVVIRVREGAMVEAVAPGNIVHAGPFRGYQSLVVLDHGQGLFTVYGHLEALQVQRGQQVVQGQTLGRATYQPVNEAHDVYFELRHQGRPQNPLEWLRPDSLDPAVPAQRQQ